MEKRRKKIEPLKKEFIRLLTDFGFKRLLGSRERPEILKRFLNAVFEGEMRITKIKFEDRELHPERSDGKMIRYDVYCTTDTGEHFIVEMQQEETENFPERILFYVSKAVVNQGARGVNYQIDPVCCIVLTKFNLSHMSRSLVKDIVLMDRRTKEIYTEKARMIFISLVEVPRRWDKCNTELLRLLYLIKNMEKLTRKSKPYLSGEYDEIFKASQTKSLTEEEAVAYSQSYLRELEHESAIRFATAKSLEKGFEQGIEKGIEQGIVQGIEQGIVQGIEKGIEKGETRMLRMNVESMRSKGLTDTMIADFLNQPLELIRSL